MRVPGRPNLAAVLVALSLVAVYLVLIVVATPTIPSAVVLRLAISANGPYLTLIAGMSALQAHLFVYSRRIRYRLGKTRAVGTSGSVLASFTSFFQLTSVGCCGLLPFWVSLALGGGAIGTAASSFLVNNSTPLTILGLMVTGASTVFTVRSISTSLHASRQASAQNREVPQPPGEAKN